jgi:SAM-dependent methyltransferase
MLKKIFRWALTHPLSRGLNIDAPDATLIAGEVIRNKPFLRCFYQDCYQYIRKNIPPSDGGIVLEIGSGAGFLKEYIPGLVTTEILKLPTVDVILDAQQLPVKHHCLRAIVMVDAFHHLPDVRLFLREASLCVRPGGVIIMVEPWVTCCSYLIYRYLHHESLDLKTDGWTIPGNGPLSDANMALPWIVFKRDRLQFDNDFPDWRVEKIRLDYPFTYLASGGLSYRSILPQSLFGFIRQLERAAQPLMGILALFAKITLRRSEN